jgi:DNA replication protein DnaC
VFSVIDSRYRSQLPLIVTTNLTPEQMRDPEDIARARIYDRVLKTGQLPAAKLGGQYRVRTDDFLKWWDNQVKQEQKNILKNLVS